MNSLNRSLTDVLLSVRDDLDCAVRSHARVLITGGANADAAAIAKWIHDRRAGCVGPFVSVDCAAPESILQSWMPRVGREPYPGHTGTLFIEEVVKMSAHMQAVLVNVLNRAPDMPIISAATGNLYDEVLAGRFREDLYYRLNIIHIVWPHASR